MPCCQSKSHRESQYPGVQALPLASGPPWACGPCGTCILCSHRCLIFQCPQVLLLMEEFLQLSEGARTAGEPAAETNQV